MREPDFQKIFLAYLNLYSIHSGQKVSVEVEKMRFKNMQRISTMICKLLNTARLNLKKS